MLQIRIQSNGNDHNFTVSNKVKYKPIYMRRCQEPLPQKVRDHFREMFYVALVAQIFFFYGTGGLGANAFCTFPNLNRLFGFKLRFN